METAGLLNVMVVANIELEGAENTRHILGYLQKVKITFLFFKFCIIFFYFSGGRRGEWRLPDSSMSWLLPLLRWRRQRTLDISLDTLNR